jgi:hypothetical protein
MNPVFVIDQDFINSQGNLANEYNRQKREFRVIKRIQGRLRRGEIISGGDLRYIETHPFNFVS